LFGAADHKPQERRRRRRRQTEGLLDSRFSIGVLSQSNHREAPRAAEHGQARRARPDGDASQEETTDTGDEPEAVGCGSQPEGKERERERESMYSNESRAMKKSQRSLGDRSGDASIWVIGKTG